MVDQRRPARVNDAVTSLRRKARFELPQQARVVPMVAEQDSHWRLMLVGVEVPAYGDAGARLAIEQAFGEKPRLQSLTVTFLRGEKLSFGEGPA